MKYWQKARRKQIEALAGALLIGFAVISLLGSAGRLASAQSTQIDEAAFRRVSNRLLCQCGSCGYMILGCNHLDCPSATYIRRTIRTALADGKTEEQAFQSIVAVYGPKILPEPPREGFAWMAWIMPFAGLLAGAGAVGLVLRHWKHSSSAEGHMAKTATAQQQTGAGAAQPVPAAVVEKYRAQIDRQLENE
jgi:cytochrome c-type biogenesis protein CcmH/NrfF